MSLVIRSTSCGGTLEIAACSFIPVVFVVILRFVSLCVALKNTKLRLLGIEADSDQSFADDLPFKQGLGFSFKNLEIATPRS